MKLASMESRVVALQLLIAGCVAVVFAGSASWLTAQALERQERRILRDETSQFAASLEHELKEQKDLSSAVHEALEDESGAEIRIDVFDAQHQRVGSTASRSAPPPGPHVIQTTLALPQGASVVASMSTGPRRRAIVALVTALLFASIPLVLASLALSRALARRALRPLSTMTGQAEAESLRSSPMPLGSSDDPTEVVTLAAAFNRLLGRLDALLQAERHFTQDAAHELRTPLTVISGELERALADEGLPAGRRHDLQRAWEQARSMSALVDALLLLRRAESLPSGSDQNAPAVNLVDVVRDVVAEQGSGATANGHECRIEAPDEVLVRGDAQLLTAAVRNVLSNACKATLDGGQVRVRIFERGEESVLVVDDAGPGVRPEDRERIFDPFFRSPHARAHREGFGLGLPLLRRVARAHGGDVRVGSSDLGGARFELCLPSWSPSRPREHTPR